MAPPGRYDKNLLIRCPHSPGTRCECNSVALEELQRRWAADTGALAAQREQRARVELARLVPPLADPRLGIRSALIGWVLLVLVVLILLALVIRNLLSLF